MAPCPQGCPGGRLRQAVHTARPTAHPRRLAHSSLVVTDRALHGLRHVRREHSIDYLGAVLLVTGVSTLLLGMVNGGEAGWTSPEIIGLLASGLVLSGTFLWWESRAAEP